MKKLLCLMLFCLLLNSTIYAGNRPGYMTTDQKDALDGADTPSASNVLATIKDVEEQDSGVQGITAGVNLSNSGTADSPILDLNISEDIDMNTSYQLKHLAAPAADGEAIRQTSKLTESSLESGIDRLNELEATDTPQFASVNIAGNYQFPQAIGSSGEALKVPAAGSLLEWGSVGGVTYAQIVVTAKSGGDYTTVQAAIDSITDEAADKRYAVVIYPGEYVENITMAAYIDLIGIDREICIISQTTGVTLTGNANAHIMNLTIKNTSATWDHYALVGAGMTIRDCKILGENGEILTYGAFNIYNSHMINTNVVSGSCPAQLTEKWNGRMQDCYLYCQRASGTYQCYAIHIRYGTGYIENCWVEISGAFDNANSGIVRQDSSAVYYINSYFKADASWCLSSTTTSDIWIQSSTNRPMGSNITLTLRDDAAHVKNTAAGNIAATNVQDAIDELDDEKADIAGADTITGLWRFDAMILTPKALADSPTSPEEGHFWWDSTVADTGPKVYLGGKWCKLLTNEGGYTRTIKIPATAARVGVTAPTPTTIENTRGLGFDADGELAFIATPIPQDWDGASDLTFKTSFCGTSGDAIADTETVKFDISYNSVAEGEAVDNGTEKTATVTYTQSGAGTDKEMIIVNITIDYDDGDQPITAGDALFIKFNRDVTTDTYSGAAIVQAWALQYTSDDVPK